MDDYEVLSPIVLVDFIRQWIQDEHPVDTLDWSESHKVTVCVLNKAVGFLSEDQLLDLYEDIEYGEATWHRVCQWLLDVSEGS